MGGGGGKTRQIQFPCAQLERCFSLLIHVPNIYEYIYVINSKFRLWFKVARYSFTKKR